MSNIETGGLLNFRIHAYTSESPPISKSASLCISNGIHQAACTKLTQTKEKRSHAQRLVSSALELNTCFRVRKILLS